MAVAIAMVLLRDYVPVSAEALRNDFSAKWAGLPTLTDLREDDATLTFRTGSADVVIGNMAAPIPWSELEGPCSSSILWPTAIADLMGHAAHMVVTVAGELNPTDLASLLTKATASALTACPTSLGVYWGSAPLVIPRQIFIDFAEKVLPHGPPLQIWVDFRVGMQESNSSGGFTSGMSALGCMEFEVQGAPEKPSELRQRLVELAGYVIKNGPVIKDGDSVGRNSRERIRVVYTDSMLGRSGRVMRLEFGSSEAKPWWKVW